MDLKTVMDEQMSGEVNFDRETADLTEFTSAWLENERRVYALMLASQAITEKTIAMAAVAHNKEEAEQALKSSLFNKPMMALIFFGYRIGQRAQKELGGVDEVKELEKLFGKGADVQNTD